MTNELLLKEFNELSVEDQQMLVEVYGQGTVAEQTDDDKTFIMRQHNEEQAADSYVSQQKNEMEL